MNDREISVPQLGDTQIYDADSKAIQLRELWREKTAVLVFVRHFG